MKSSREHTHHTLLITLGSNYEADRNIAYALEHIYGYLYLLAQTDIVETEPIDFPYPSASFYNTVLLCRTQLPLEEVQIFLDKLEEACGRTLEYRQMHPEQISLDADLIIWDEWILKTKDLRRPYLSEGLVSLSLPIEYISIHGLRGIDV